MAKKPKTVMLTLRIPISLREDLRAAAKDDHRSVNGLVVAMLFGALQENAAKSSR